MDIKYSSLITREDNFFYYYLTIKCPAMPTGEHVDNRDNECPQRLLREVCKISTWLTKHLDKVHTCPPTKLPDLLGHM